MFPVSEICVVRSSHWQQRTGRRGAKGRIGFGGDQRDIPSGVRATGGCCYGDQRAEIRGDFTYQGLVDDLEPVGLATSMKRGPANESVQVAVVGSIWGFGDKMDGTFCVYRKESRSKN